MYILRTSKNSALALLLLVIYTVFLSILLPQLYEDNMEYWAIEITVLAIAQILITLVCFRYSNIGLISTFSFIALFSYIFQFGNLFCYAIGYKRNITMARIAYNTSQYAFKKGMSLALICLGVFTLGGILNSFIQKKENLTEITNTAEIPMDFYKIIGITIIAISIPFYLITQYNTIKVTIAFGSYTALAENRLPGYITSLGKFIYIGIFCIIFYCKHIDNKKHMKAWITVFLLLIIFNFMLGARSEPMTILFAFVIFYFICINSKFSKKNVLIILIVVFLLADLMYSIQISRNSGFSIKNILQHFFTNGFDAILEELLEFGVTGYSTSAVVEKISTHNPSWFLIKELSSLFPIPIESKYTVVGSVAAGKPELGTSFIGEMYYYFGNYCYLACFFIAIYITSITKWIRRKIDKGEYYYFLMMLMWIWQQLNCIRATFNLAIKTIIYSYVLFFVVKSIYITMRNKSGVYS